MSKYPELPNDDSRKKLLEDLEYGGFYGYATARQMPLDWPSTLEFEEAVLRDVMKRSISIASDESDGFHGAAIAKCQRLACGAYKLAEAIFERFKDSDPDAREWEWQLDELCEALAIL